MLFPAETPFPAALTLLRRVARHERDLVGGVAHALPSCHIVCRFCLHSVSPLFSLLPKLLIAFNLPRSLFSSKMEKALMFVDMFVEIFV